MKQAKQLKQNVKVPKKAPKQNIQISEDKKTMLTKIAYEYQLSKLSTDSASAGPAEVHPSKATPAVPTIEELEVLQQLLTKATLKISKQQVDQFPSCLMQTPPYEPDVDYQAIQDAFNKCKPSQQVQQFAPIYGNQSTPPPQQMSIVNSVEAPSRSSQQDSYFRKLYVQQKCKNRLLKQRLQRQRSVELLTMKRQIQELQRDDRQKTQDIHALKLQRKSQQLQFEEKDIQIRQIQEVLHALSQEVRIISERLSAKSSPIPQLQRSLQRSTQSEAPTLDGSVIENSVFTDI